MIRRDIENTISPEEVVEDCLSLRDGWENGPEFSQLNVYGERFQTLLTRGG